MALTISDMRDGCIHARHLLQRAHSQHFAVGAFRIDGEAALQAVARAAQRQSAPVIAEIGHDEAAAIGMLELRDAVTACRRDFRVEMYICLADAHTLHQAKRAIDAGFEFVRLRLDSVASDLQQAAQLIEEISSYAKFTGALIESGLPRKRQPLFEVAGLDLYALELTPSIPPVKSGSRKLEDIQQLGDSTNLPLSLYGADGLPAYCYTEMIKLGIHKISVVTETGYAFRRALEKVLADHPHEYASYKLLPAAYEALEGVVEDKMALFGSAHRAVY